MSSFGGCHNNVMKIISLIFVFFIIFVHTSMADGGYPFYESLSREEMVQLAGYGEQKLSTVLVTGTVLCEACFHNEPQLRVWPISGALVTVNCHTSRRSSKTRSAQAVTDEYGDFLIDLPSHLHAIPNLDKACSVKVLQMPKNSTCRSADVGKHKELKLSSIGNGIRNYTAGKIKFHHLTSKSSKAHTKKGSDDKNIVL